MGIKFPRIPFFRIFYSTTFTFFAFILLALLLITPGDHAYQSFRAGELYRIIIVGAVYFVTFILAVFIYAARIFSTRSALAHIPREWDLSGDGKKNAGIGLGMPRSVGRIVRQSWERSAIIAYEGTPRDLKGEEQTKHFSSKKRKRKRSKTEERQDSTYESSEPVWGRIRHPGWAGPESPDFPNLHFETVVSELANIIEAKGVSLAPNDPLWQAKREQSDEEAPDEPALDPTVVETLQRPPAMALREYVTQLSSFGMIEPFELANEFLDLYEYARFSGKPLQERQFRHLTSILNEILHAMQPPSQQMVDELHASETVQRLHSSNGEEISTGHGQEPSLSTKPTPQEPSSESHYSSASRSDAQVTAYTAPSRARMSTTLSHDSRGSEYTNASVIHNELPSEAQSLESSSSSHRSVSGGSACSMPDSVVWTAEARTSLELPHAGNDSAMGGF